MQLTVSIPATSANIGPGFDTWGMALNLRNDFHATITRESNTCRVTYENQGLAADMEKLEGPRPLPTGDDNLVCQSYKNLMTRAGREPLPLHIHIIIRIPFERGLGSSSTAILAGMAIANEVLRERHGESFTMEEIFQIATETEGHPDNIAPALLGGWVLSLPDETTGAYHTFSLPVNAPVEIAGVVPALLLSTEKARKVISDSYDFNTVIYQQSRTALMTHLLSKANWNEDDADGFALAISERIHQSQRAQYIPGMQETFAYWKKLGAYGSFLSGAGTTLLAFWPKNSQPIEKDLGKAFREKQVHSLPLSAKLDWEGMTILKTAATY